MLKDPIVEEVREAGAKIAKKCNNDFHKMCDYLRKKEKKHKNRIVSKKSRDLLQKTGS